MTLFKPICITLIFSIDDMADTFNMSRSSFYRKIKGVLDLTPNDYLASWNV